MATSVHIPKPLLTAVDRRARALRVSRNQLVIRALEREMNQPLDWSPGFFERLSETDAGTEEAVDEMLSGIVAARSSKTRPCL